MTKNIVNVGNLKTDAMDLKGYHVNINKFNIKWSATIYKK